MKERPILFSGPMVKAILEGRKTQARRECLLDLLREPTFVTLDKYGGVVARPDEVGRFYGFPVIVSDAMPENVLAMVPPG